MCVCVLCVDRPLELHKTASGMTAIPLLVTNERTNHRYISQRLCGARRVTGGSRYPRPRSPTTSEFIIIGIIIIVWGGTGGNGGGLNRLHAWERLSINSSLQTFRFSPRVTTNKLRILRLGPLGQMIRHSGHLYAGFARIPTFPHSRRRVRPRLSSRSTRRIASPL